MPYHLTNPIRQKRVNLSIELYNFLSKLSPKQLNKVYTQDETWIYFSIPRKSMWIENNSKIPQNVQKSIHSKKAMISVIWGRSGIKSITMLPQKQSFTKEFFSDFVLNDLSKKVSTKNKFFHCDNARPHFCQEKFLELGMKRLNHPPYNPDLAPSDFFLFGLVKKLIEGCNFKNEYELFQRISEVLYSIPKHFFRLAYEEWINRLDQVIKLGGEYIIN